MYFRSNWEANFARVQNYLGKQWQYEPESFQLTPMMSYTPDFLVDGVYYELKGRFTDLCQMKHQLFMEHDSNRRLVVIDAAQYQKLRLEFKHLIPNWEGK